MLEWGPQKAGKVRGTKERQLEEHFAANQVNWKQVNNMIAILERQSYSEVKMKTASRNCGNVSEKF